MQSERVKEGQSGATWTLVGALKTPPLSFTGPTRNEFRYNGSSEGVHSIARAYIVI